MPLFMENCLGIAKRAGTTAIATPLVLIAALLTYYWSVGRHGYGPQLARSLAGGAPGNTYLFCVSLDLDGMCYNTAYVDPRDTWFGVPVSDTHTRMAENCGLLCPCYLPVADNGGVSVVFGRILRIQPPAAPSRA